MLTYADLPITKKAFIFELDDVLFPKKDYLLQVYYLFSNFLNYTDGYPNASDLVDFFKNSLEFHGPENIFDKAQQAFGLEEKYRDNFNRLHQTARLPLKLVLFEEILSLLQDIVVDRKKIFIVTAGNPEQQLNKIRQTEWQGLGEYLTVYFSDEIGQKPDPGVLSALMAEHQLSAHDLLLVGNSATDQQLASNAGIDYREKSLFLTIS